METSNRQPSLLDELFVEHQGRVFRAAYRLTGSVQDAEDVLQTVFLRLAQHAEGTAARNASSYLYRAAINASIDLLRSRQERVMVAVEEAERSVPAADSPERAHQAREIRAWLRRALARLPGREGEIFALRYLEGHGNTDIARMLGVSRVGVAVALHRARRRLQQELRQMNMGGRS